MNDTLLVTLYFVVPAVDFVTAALLWWVVWRSRPAPQTLKERAWVATAIWAGVSMLSLMGLLRIGGVVLSSEARFYLFLVAILLPSVVNFFWLVRFASGRYGRQ